MKVKSLFGLCAAALFLLPILLAGCSGGGADATEADLKNRPQTEQAQHKDKSGE